METFATERVSDNVERAGLLRALERLEGMMASLERALREDPDAVRREDPDAPKREIPHVE
jgi:hypothetical protein